MNFNEMIHAERARLLRDLPKGAKVFCSAGCSGSWYFKWIEQEYGWVDEHVGVELYSPRPDDLPANVNWIQNSVASMVDVRSESADLLFSGQNIEHLYPEDMKGFLVEAARIVKPGGVLCMDSPNRAMTQKGGYIQPEHVLELTVAEAVSLVVAAGFEIEKVDGIWLCESKNYERLAIDATEDPVSRGERLAAAKTNPEKSFIWWIVARRKPGASGDTSRLVDSIFLKEFSGFARSRYSLGCGSLKAALGTESIVEVSRRDSGYLFYGPYVPLPPGHYCAEFRFKFLQAGGRVVLDVVSAVGGKVHAVHAIEDVSPQGWQSISLEFELAEYTTGVEARVVVDSADAFFRFGAQLLPLA